MYRHGHLGITLLTLAPLSYALIVHNQFALAGLLALGVLFIEPLPDNDHWIPGLSHRGVSHSLLTAGIIGLICAGCGWLLGQYLTVPLAHWLQTTVLPATNITAVVIATEQLAALTPENARRTRVCHRCSRDLCPSCRRHHYGQWYPAVPPVLSAADLTFTSSCGEHTRKHCLLVTWRARDGDCHLRTLSVRRSVPVRESNSDHVPS